jgi:general secretion pathway protein D
MNTVMQTGSESGYRIAPPRHDGRRAALGRVLIFVLLTGCEPVQKPAIAPLASSASELAASARINGGVTAAASPLPMVSYGATRAAGSAGSVTEGSGGDYSLDFAETDVREVVAQILGGLLHKTYTIDPAVHGTVTLHTAQPIPARQLLPTLQLLLANAGAALTPLDGVYRVIPVTALGASGSAVIPLRYVSAEELAKVLQPVAGSNTKVAAETGMNALLVSGDPPQIEAMQELVKSFDEDALANQSYALLPVTSGSAHDFADAMQGAFRGKSGASLAGLVRVVPLSRLNIVLIVSSQPRYIDAAKRVYALIDHERRTTVRSWHVFYLQSSSANDIAYTLQMAFTPNNVTAQPDAPQGSSGTSRGASTSGLGGGTPGGGMGGSGMGSAGQGGGSAAASLLGSGSIGSANPAGPSTSAATMSRSGSGAPPPAAANPLLGGLDQSSGGDDEDVMRILPNAQNNAVLIFGTRQEEETVTAMLHKIDILPMQVRIDATIAEVTLNDNLQYGTQFFFKSGGINGILNNATASVAAPSAVALGTTLPGFLLSGNGLGGAPFAISALQAVTTVNVLSSPQITVLDNQMARLQVGALVPYLTASSQSTLAANAPVINSISYQPTGVIMEVTPRVNSGGQITLDVSQQVSDVDTTASTSGINSPTFKERSVSSRVVLQDGQTIGLAGLISDSISRGNQGIPWLKDIPILGALAGTQTNTRTRTELLVLITPHVIRDQNEMRTLTEDMREALGQAASLPAVAQTERFSGSADPNRRLRERIRQRLEHDDP